MPPLLHTCGWSAGRARYSFKRLVVQVIKPPTLLRHATCAGLVHRHAVLSLIPNRRGQLEVLPYGSPSDSTAARREVALPCPLGEPGDGFAVFTEKTVALVEILPGQPSYKGR